MNWIFNYTQLIEDNFIDIQDNFLLEGGQVISDVVLEVLGKVIIEAATPVYLFEKETRLKMAIIAIPQIDNVYALEVKSSESKVNEEQITKLSVKYENKEIALGTDLFPQDFELVKESLLLAVFNEVFKAGNVYYKKVDTDFDMQNFEIIIQKDKLKVLKDDKDKKLLLINTTNENYICPIIENAKGVNVLLCMGSKEVVAHFVGKDIQSMDNDLVDKIAEKINIIENLIDNLQNNSKNQNHNTSINIAQATQLFTTL